MDGLTIQNVLFNYYVDGHEPGAATVGNIGPCLSFLCGAALEGVASASTKLRMTFLEPMWYFEFSMARESLVASTAQLTLFDSNLAVMGGYELELWNEPPAYSWAEGEFTEDPDHDPRNYLGAVEISFDPGSSGRFWIDEIEGQHAAISVPEPMSPLLLLGGLFGLAFVGWRRRMDAAENALGSGTG